MVYVNDDLAAVLGDCFFDDVVFVVLGCCVGAAEELFYAFDSIDVAFC